MSNLPCDPGACRDAPRPAGPGDCPARRRPQIVSVSSGSPDSSAATQIDATGLTVLPGLIDTHRHLLVNQELDTDEALVRWIESELASSLNAYLESGITTIMSTGDYFPEIVDVRRRLQDGELQGPRLLIAGPVFTASDGHPAVTICRDNPWCRAMVAVEVDSREAASEHARTVAAAGVDALKVVYDGRLGVRIADDVLAAIGEEAGRHGIPLIVHSTSMHVLDLGADRLVHLPRLEEDGHAAGSRLKESMIPVATTVGVAPPIGHDRLLTLVRQFWDAGATVAFGTDTPVGAREALWREIDLLSRVLTPHEILTSLTVNAARHLGLEDEIGTLKAGKAADILIVDGDPLADIADLANVVLVVQQGEVVIDNR